MPLLIAALLGLSAAVIVLYPLLGLDRRAGGVVAPAAPGESAERERAAKGALREVEFDHLLGNLEDADYRALRERYEGRALAALKARYLCEQEFDALIERQLDALRAAEAVAARARAANGTAPATSAKATNGHAAATRPAAPLASRRQLASSQGTRARRRRGGGA